MNYACLWVNRLGAKQTHIVEKESALEAAKWVFSVDTVDPIHGVEIYPLAMEPYFYGMKVYAIEKPEQPVENEAV